MRIGWHINVNKSSKSPPFTKKFDLDYRDYKEGCLSEVTILYSV